jgi:hypothetical protein
MSLTGMFGSLHRATAGATVGRPGVYKVFRSSKLDPKSGTRVEDLVSVSVPQVFQGTVSNHERVDGAGAPLQIGDVTFEFPVSDLADGLSLTPTGRPSTSDRIVVGGVEYRVIDWQQISATLYRFTARRRT